MKYIFKNIKSFFKTEKTIFLLLLLCVVTSSFIINFSYGLYQNYNIVKVETDSDTKQIDIPFDNSEDAYVSKGELKEAVLTFSPELNEAFNLYLAYPHTKETGDSMFCRFCIDNGRIAPAELFKENMIKFGTLKSGDYFTPEEEANGEKVALVFDDLADPESFTKQLMINDDTILFQGEEFRIVGYQAMHSLIVPFESLKDNTVINMLTITFKKPLTRPQYNEIKQKIEFAFPGIAKVPDLEIPENESYYLYNTIILISIMIAILAAINFAVLYKYILSKRTKSLAIFRICGCTKRKALGIFLSECMLIAIPAFALTTLAYDKIALPRLGKHFEYICSAYSLKLYLLIGGIYIAASFIVLLLMISFGFLRKNIAQTKGE